MKSLIKSILALIILSNIIQAQQWKLKISLEKETFVEEEAIYLFISLKNISGTTFERNSRVFEFLLRDVNNNDQADMYKKDVIPGPEMILKTFPGDKILRICELVASFGDKNSNSPFYKFKEGTYTIRVRYEDILSKNRKDTLRHKFYYSNELMFRVVKPSKKDLILKNKFINIFNQRKVIGFKEATKRYIELIKEFPNNPYVSSIILYLWVSPTYLYKDEITELLNKYPNKHWAPILYSSLKYEQQKNIRINGKLKGTLLSKYIKYGNIEERAVREYEKMQNNYKYGGEK